jgi:hypothetical protein
LQIPQKTRVNRKPRYIKAQLSLFHYFPHWIIDYFGLQYSQEGVAGLSQEDVREWKEVNDINDFMLSSKMMGNE